MEKLQASSTKRERRDLVVFTNSVGVATARRHLVAKVQTFWRVRLRFETWTLELVAFPPTYSL